jgi:hypothetical protein
MRGMTAETLSVHDFLYVTPIDKLLPSMKV